MVYSVFMIVYIEYAILDNMAIDTVLLYLVCVTIGHKLYWHRIILSSVVGTVCALVVPLVHIWIGYVIKSVCLLSMCYIVCGRKRLHISVVLLLVYTFLLGGMILGILSLLGVEYNVDNISCTYYSTVPIGMYVLAVVLCVMLVLYVVRYIQHRRTTGSAVVDIVLMLSGQHLPCSGYIDSGNMLLVEGVPVCFVCGRLGKKVSQLLSVAVIRNNSVKVQYTTMSGSRQTVGIRGMIAIEDSVHNVIVCVSNRHSAHGSDVLVNYKLMEGNI